MTITDILNIVNSPTTLIILGTSCGLLFVSYVWSPLKTRKTIKTNRYKKEAFFRLIELETSFENQYSTKIISNLLEGKTSLNTEFKNCELRMLIYSGWSEYAYKNTFKTLEKLENLVENSNTVIDKTKTKQGLLLIDTLTMYLKNINDN